MSQKRLFEVLDAMNQHDIANNTRLVAVSGTLISADTIKAGTVVKMGCDTQVAHQLLKGEVTAILVIIDKKEYEKFAAVNG